jgi:hypothetical protein
MAEIPVNAILADEFAALFASLFIQSFRYCSGAIPTPLRAAVRFAAFLGAQPEVRGAME